MSNETRKALGTAHTSDNSRTARNRTGTCVWCHRNTCTE